MHADRTNRVMLALIGLLAVAIGIGGLLISGGVFRQRFAHRLATDNQFVRYFAREGGWLWPSIAGAAFVILLLSLFWLLRLLFSTDRAGDIALQAAHPSRRESRLLAFASAPRVALSVITQPAAPASLRQLSPRRSLRRSRATTGC